jgi:hypothetical protein
VESGEPTYETISAGSLHNCAVSTEGKPVCWGTGESPNGGGSASGSSPRKRTPPDLRRNQTDPPQGDFLDTAAGDYHTSGLRTDRSVVCWGHSNRGQATSPGGGSPTSARAPIIPADCVPPARRCAGASWTTAAFGPGLPRGSFVPLQPVMTLPAAYAAAGRWNAGAAPSRPRGVSL